MQTKNITRKETLASRFAEFFAHPLGWLEYEKRPSLGAFRLSGCRELNPDFTHPKGMYCRCTTAR